MDVERRLRELRSPRAVRPTSSPPSDASAPIDCDGRSHHVALHRSQVVTPAHDLDAERTLTLLTGSPPPTCMLVADAVEHVLQTARVGDPVVPPRSAPFSHLIHEDRTISQVVDEVRRLTVTDAVWDGAQRAKWETTIAAMQRRVESRRRELAASSSVGIRRWAAHAAARFDARQMRLNERALRRRLEAQRPEPWNEHLRRAAAVAVAVRLPEPIWDGLLRELGRPGAGGYLALRGGGRAPGAGTASWMRRRIPTALIGSRTMSPVSSTGVVDQSPADPPSSQATSVT